MHHPLLEERGKYRVGWLCLPHVSPRARPNISLPSASKPTEGDKYDLIVLATPPFAQVRQIEVLKHVSRVILCEKPAGLGSSELESLLQRDPSLHWRVLVNYQLRFNPNLDLLRSLLGGPWERITVVYRSAARTNRGMAAWCRDRAQGGGVNFAILSHLIDLIHVLAGQLKPDLTSPGVEGMDSVRLSGELQDGRQTIIEVDSLAADACFSIGLGGSGGERWLDLMTGQVSSEPVLHPSVDERGVKTLSSLAERPWRASQRRLYEVLFGEVASPDPLATLSDAIRVHRVLEAATRPYCENKSSHSASNDPLSPGATT
jgi:predicted dehydrogenase